MKRLLTILILALLAAGNANAAFGSKKPAEQSAEQKQESSDSAKTESKEEAKPAAPASSEAPARSGSKAQTAKKPAQMGSSATLTEADRVWLRKAANVIGKAN